MEDGSPQDDVKARRREQHRRWREQKLRDDPDYFRRAGRKHWAAHKDEINAKRKGRRATRVLTPEQRERRLVRAREKYAQEAEARRAYYREWAAANPERVREYGRKTYAKHREATAASARQRYKRDPTKKREYQRAQWHSLKFLSRRFLSDALRYGHLTKPDACSTCGVVLPSPFIHGHHTDYTKPLDVVWVCTACHGKLHRKSA